MKNWLLAYEQALRAAIAAEPKKFAYGPERVTTVVYSMKAGFETGNFNITPVVKATCKALGINPTFKAIKEYIDASV